MTNRRFTRLTNAFSKEIENHCHGLALCMMNYNFCRKHQTLKQTPAQAAGIADHQWTLDDVVQMIDAYLAEQAELAYEQEFAAKWTAPRSTPKTYPPTPKDQIPLPWYLKPDGDGQGEFKFS